MKVLLLTQVLPYPPDSGPKVKTWNVIKYLAEFHEITLVSYVRGDQEDEIQQLRRYCAEVHTVQLQRNRLLDGIALLRSIATRQPFIILRDDRKAMRALVSQLIAANAYDLVHADQINMAQFALSTPSGVRILDTHNALWLLYYRLHRSLGPGFTRWLWGREWRSLMRYEGQTVKLFDAVLTVSEEDKLAIESASGVLDRIKVIPIAVDVEETDVISRAPQASDVLHIGTMFWPPNVEGVLWFLRNVWPLIFARRPDLVFNIVGSRPPKSIQRYNGPSSGVRVLGYVPNARPILEQAGVIVVPLHAGGGMRVKLLNALAQGIPIVSTSVGCEGIAVEDQEHILIADYPQAFANAVLDVLDNPEQARRLSENGRVLVETLYDYRIVCRRLDEVYASALDGRKGAHVPG